MGSDPSPQAPLTSEQKEALEKLRVAMKKTAQAKVPAANVVDTLKQECGVLVWQDLLNAIAGERSTPSGWGAGR